MRFWGMLGGIGAVGFLVQCASAGTSVVPGCGDRLDQVCRRLRASPAGVIGTKADGTIHVNPLTLTRDWPAQYRHYLELRNVNRANFEGRILPVFRVLKAILLEHVQAMPANVPYRRELVGRVQAMELRVESYERCLRPNRTPFVASYDHGSTVLICPMVTHLDPSVVLTVLAHELGHSVDLCDDALRSVNVDRLGNSDYLAGFPFRTIHACSAAAHRAPDGSIRIERGSKFHVCDREGEIYADYLSARLTDEFIRRQKAGEFSLVDFPEQPDEAALHLVFYRIDSACDSDPRYRDYVNPSLQGREAQRLMSCQGVIGAVACTDEQVVSE